MAIESIGVELGSTYVKIYAQGKLLLNEPAMLAIDTRNTSVIAIGGEAGKMLDRTPKDIRVERPLGLGGVSNWEELRILLNHFITQAVGKKVFMRPRALVTISGACDQTAERQLILAMLQAGTRRAQLLSRPMAAAVGAQLSIKDARSRLIVDIGGYNSHVAGIAKGKILKESSDLNGGDAFTAAIAAYIELKHNLRIGTPTAENIKRAIGTVHPDDDRSMSLPVAGLGKVSGLPKQIDITRAEVKEAMERPLQDLMGGLQQFFGALSGELIEDAHENGITLTGGGALLDGLPAAIKKYLKINCYQAPNPAECCVIGCSRVLENLDEYGALLGGKRK